ncbi:hypothetical protein [Amycolatopsis arida]|uniref:hypothetical protein n=1 Tax=Amycolatopsis arida TaxID=587909 RepID=UPI000B85CA12|nr:hypothetical protein [Amycolatopsis arida]
MVERVGLVVADDRGRVGREILGGVHADPPVEQFRLAPGLQRAVGAQDLGDGAGVLRPEVLRGVAPLPLAEPLDRPPVLVRLVVPISRSSIATIGIYTASQAWNGFLFPLVLTLTLWEYQTQFAGRSPAA